MVSLDQSETELQSSTQEPKQFASLGALIPSVLNSQSWQLKLLAHWPTIMGPAHSRVRIERIQGSTLILGVFDQAWLQELYFLQDAVKQKINNYMQEHVITTIKFKRAEPIVGLKPYNVPTGIVNEIAPNKIIEITVPERQALAQCKDDELREYLQKYLTRCKQ